MTIESKYFNSGILINKLLRISSSLSSETDLAQILENILDAAMEITGADEGRIYKVTSDNLLTTEIVHTKTKDIYLASNDSNRISDRSIRLFADTGIPDLRHAVTYAFHKKETVNIPNAHDENKFDFSETFEFDSTNSYKSASFLYVPMKNYESEITGILKLTNASNPTTGKIIPFSQRSQVIIEALSSQAAISITNRTLVIQLEDLFESFISLINHAIDDKSPHTGGHCERVPALTMMIADAVTQCQVGPFSDYSLSDANRKELKMASLLHDCGKITTPVHVVDKATKLETIFDRIQLIELRIEILMRDIHAHLGNKLITESDAQQKQECLIDDFNFLCHCNIGVESMSESDIRRVHDTASKYAWRDFSGSKRQLLSEDEVLNLTIKSGTLNASERKIINRHIEVSISMLEKLKWPKHLMNVTEYAGAHHERMDGKGYPKGLTRDEMSIPARCMAIADIFEALTAKDRPYKKGKSLSESLFILGKMKLNNHIDPDLFNIFMWSKVYEEYAHIFMDSSQIDLVDLSKIPGYETPLAS